MSNVLSLLTEPWAILPEKKAEMDAIYITHLRGDKIDLKALEARLGRPLGNQREYEVVNGKAVVPVEGPIAKRMSLFSSISGGSSTAKIKEQFDLALSDPSVREILLYVDSPGGAVDGTKALADYIFESRGKKPITSFIDGLGASAAYWIAAAADKVYVKDATTMVGSIGVITTHVDTSAQEAADGIKTTVIHAGKYKATGHPHAPLSEVDKGIMQDRLDAMYSIFVDDIARYRGVSVDVVLKDMADGRVFMGLDAVEQGLVDGVATVETILSASNTTNGPRASVEALPTNGPKETPMDEIKMTAEELESKLQAARSEGATAAATAERERIKAILDLSAPGQEAIVQKLAFEGNNSPGDAALALNAITKKTLAAQDQALKTEAPEPLPTGPAQPTAATPDPLKERWDASEQVRSLYGGDYAKYESAMKKTAAMRADGRILHNPRSESK